jgi:hypothetical protein
MSAFDNINHMISTPIDIPKIVVSRNSVNSCEERIAYSLYSKRKSSCVLDNITTDYAAPSTQSYRVTTEAMKTLIDNLGKTSTPEGWFYDTSSDDYSKTRENVCSVKPSGMSRSMCDIVDAWCGTL